MSNVLVDTSVWIEYFKNNAEVAVIIDDLLDKNQIFITGPVIAELIHGVKTEKELELLKMYLDGVSYLSCDIDDWKNAGILSYNLRRDGTTIPLTDVVIAAVSIRHSLKVYTFDSHFKKIPGVDVL